MNLIQTLILSLIEGASEFLPISSTAHLILAGKILGITPTDFYKSFEIFIQLGAIMAVIVLYWRRLLTNFKVWKTVIVAFIPSAIVGLTLYKLIKDVLFENYPVILWALLTGGVVLMVLDKTYKSNQTNQTNLESITLKQAFLIGLAQSVSIIPGVSRAGASIVGGMLSGLSKETATEFSFILAVPTMVAAVGLDLVKTDLRLTTDEFRLMGVGFIASFIFALIFIKWLINFVKNHSFASFGVYRIILALAFFFLFLD